MTDPNLTLEALQAQHSELQRTLEEYEALFAAMPVMLWYKDTHNKMIRVNKAAAAFEGKTPDDLAGKFSEEVYPKEQAAAFYRDDLEVINSGTPKLNIIESHTVPSTGDLMWLQTNKVPLHDKTGQVIGLVAIAIDVTDQFKAKHELQEAYDQLEDQNRKLTRVREFLSATLDYIANALQQGAQATELRRYVAVARGELDRML
jgi:PAS domain S-box-containing protein